MINNIRRRVKAGNYRFTLHAFERCTERNISPEEIKEVILSGEAIEDYPKDKYGQVVLFLELLMRSGYYMCSVRLTRFGLLRHMTQL